MLVHVCLHWFMYVKNLHCKFLYANIPPFSCWNFHTANISKMIYIHNGWIFSTARCTSFWSPKWCKARRGEILQQHFFSLLYWCIQMNIIKWTHFLHGIGTYVSNELICIELGTLVFIFKYTNLLLDGPVCLHRMIVPFFIGIEIYRN